VALLEVLVRPPLVAPVDLELTPRTHTTRLTAYGMKGVQQSGQPRWYAPKCAEASAVPLPHAPMRAADRRRRRRRCCCEALGNVFAGMRASNWILMFCLTPPHCCQQLRP
jgi:hypothetical protein